MNLKATNQLNGAACDASSHPPRDFSSQFISYSAFIIANARNSIPKHVVDILKSK